MQTLQYIQNDFINHLAIWQEVQQQAKLVVNQSLYLQGTQFIPLELLEVLIMEMPQ